MLKSIFFYLSIRISKFKSLCLRFTEFIIKNFLYAGSSVKIELKRW